MGKTKKCDKCNKNIRNCNYEKHFNSCEKNKKSNIENYKTENGYQCPICYKFYKKLGLKFHIWRNHTEEGKIYVLQGGPNRNYKKGTREVWNKGLTKENSEIIKKSSEALKQKYLNKELIASSKGRKHSQETKKKISEIRTKYLKENPGKIPYRLNHSSKESYPEKIFREELEKLKITGWEQEYSNSIYQYDFAFVNLKIDVEIDGSTHLSKKVIEIDKRRDEFSVSQGWKVIRFSAKEVKNNLKNCIEKLLNLINENC